MGESHVCEGPWQLVNKISAKYRSLIKNKNTVKRMGYASNNTKSYIKHFFRVTTNDRYFDVALGQL